MISFTSHHTYGNITVEESFWTGKKTVIVNGQILNKAKRNTYLLPDGKEIKIKGNVMLGVEAEIDGEKISIGKKATGFDIFLLMLPVLVNIILGNFLPFLLPIPIVSGALGGGISAGIACAFAPKIKDADSKGRGFLWSLAATGVSLAVCIVLGFILVMFLY